MKNLVVIGYGGMGGWHVERAQKSDVVNLLGIYDIDPKKSELARSRGIKKLWLGASKLGRPLYEKLGFIQQESYMELTLKD